MPILLRSKSGNEVRWPQLSATSNGIYSFDRLGKKDDRHAGLQGLTAMSTISRKHARAGHFGNRLKSVDFENLSDSSSAFAKSASVTVE